MLLLSMAGNRWCANIGRPHKSNGIFYVIDLQVRWQARAEYYQHLVSQSQVAVMCCTGAPAIEKTPLTFMSIQSHMCMAAMTLYRV